MKFKDMKVATQLSLGFGALVALLALMGGVSVWKAGTLETDFRLILEDRYPKIDELHAAQDNVHTIALGLRDTLLLTDPQAVAREITRIEASRAHNAKMLATLHEQIQTDQGKRLLAAVDQALSAYAPQQERFMAQVANGQKEAAAQLLTGDMMPTQAAYLDTLEKLIDFQESLMASSAAEARADISSLRQTSIALGAMAVLAALGMALLIIRSLTGPLARAVEVARAVAGGDLSLQIHGNGDNETAQLLKALQSMQASLATVVQGVRHNAESVALASAEIAQGNQDLSHRTEEQASALQQTAASMEQLGSTVVQNADNARQANQLALGASSVAIQGGEVVGQVVSTMRDIQDSSRKIADIITVIDGIAFQTNILALNAAVEAARAGEQGRGFAVVASEVRSLAGRSADAAREIKRLINASVERVEQGTTLVDRAGSTMQEVVSAIRRVTDIMGEISAASTEQSTGVAQVGEAVGQMDQTTQQNAALVEQSAAAAESLKQQAQQLLAAVSVFTLGHQGGMAASSAGRSTTVSTPQITSAPRARPQPAPRPAAAVAHAPSPAAPVAAKPAPAAATAGGDDDWTSF